MDLRGKTVQLDALDFGVPGTPLLIRRVGTTLEVSQALTLLSSVTLTGALQVSANDGAALGASGTAWSDLFLASGAVINFAAANYTMTHSTGLLTLSNALTVTTGAILGAGLITSSGPTSGIGYRTGAGGAVTQITSKSTGVTLDTITGTITMQGAALAADTTVAFTLTDSAIAATDAVLVLHESAGTLGAYSFGSTAAAGSASISVHNLTPASLSEAIVLRFVVIKSVNS